MDSAINSNNADISSTDYFVHMPITYERKKIPAEKICSLIWQHKQGVKNVRQLNPVKSKWERYA